MKLTEMARDQRAERTDFIRMVQTTSNSIRMILFHDNQMDDIRRFCCRNSGGVLGIGKTYDVGELLVTPTFYRDLSVVNRSSGDHPVCFGPVLVHCPREKKEPVPLITFFLEIRFRLTDEERANLVVGSYERPEVMESIRKEFPDCTHVLCSKRLRENTNRYLKGVPSYSKADREDIVNAIFGDKGLLTHWNNHCFTDKLEELRSTIAAKDKDAKNAKKKFLPYFEDKLFPSLEKNVIEPLRQGKIQHPWVNKASECFLLSMVTWSAVSMPMFVELFKRHQDNFSEDCWQAIVNQGKFKLADRFAGHVCDSDSWETMTDQEKGERAGRFLLDCGDGTSIEPTARDSDEEEEEEEGDM